MGLLGELRRRNVIRMAGLYLVGAWLVVQVTETVLPVFAVPAWVLRAIIVALAIGFLPALVFSWVFELTPEGLKREGRVERRQSITPRTGRRMERLFLLLLALGLAFFAFDRFVLAPLRDEALVAATADSVRAETRATLQPDAAAGRSIAVLPFANLSTLPDQDYFSDGLAEDMITALAQFAGLRVINRNSSFQFRDGAVDVAAIGAALKVSHLLTGSVRRHGDQVRINVALVDVADGSTRWTQRYDRPYADLFALQDEITAAVAAELKARLIDEAAAGSQGDRPPSGNLAAYNAFLLGSFHTARSTEDDNHKAIAALEEAIALDPGYARAHAALAGVLMWNASRHVGGEAARAAYDRAKSEVRTAIALQPDLAYAHWIYGELLRTADLDIFAAEAALRRAVQLAPNDSAAVGALAANTAALGNTDEAIELARRAAELDPLRSSAHYWLSLYLGSAGRVDEAEAAIRQSLALGESTWGNVQLSTLQLLRGDAQAALETARKVEDPDWRTMTVALALQKSADPVAAGVALADMTGKYADDGAYQIAEVHALRGDADQLFVWLERARRNRDSGLDSLLVDPLMHPYRDDPRFAALCAELGLPLPASR